MQWLLCRAYGCPNSVDEYGRLCTSCASKKVSKCIGKGCYNDSLLNFPFSWCGSCATKALRNDSTIQEPAMSTDPKMTKCKTPSCENKYFNSKIDFCDSCQMNMKSDSVAIPESTMVTKSPLTSQVGGNHYSKLAIQPVEYIHKNGIPFIEGSVIKYVTRWRDKGGVKDLEKARHFIDLLIELEVAK